MSSWSFFRISNQRAAKRHPALVLQPDGLGAELPQTVVATIASNMARAGHASKCL
jgi:mRNA interferase MazF